MASRGHPSSTTWRCYTEGYPRGCFLDKVKGLNVRKHVPFERFFDDVAAGTLPTYSFLVPDMNNGGHDKGLKHADAWATRVLGPLLGDPAFVKGTLLVVTFDEGNIHQADNHIYCAFWGESVVPGAKVTERVDHYGLLRTVESLFGLPTLTSKDASAKPITGIWS